MKSKKLFILKNIINIGKPTSSSFNVSKTLNYVFIYKNGFSFFCLIQEIYSIFVLDEYHVNSKVQDETQNKIITYFLYIILS